VRDKVFFEKGMNHIIEESKRLHTMVLKLLEVSRQVKSDDLEAVEAGAILRDVCDSMAIRAQRYKKSIRTDIESDLWIMGQTDRIRQLFINLIDNAIKYSWALSEIKVKGLQADGKVRFVFDNPGDTISEEQLSHLFEPFYLAHSKEAEQGSVGLGLSIVKSIVDELEGSISVISHNNQTVVTVELDRTNAAREEDRHD
jgi:signal transduction histidine kinase